MTLSFEQRSTNERFAKGGERKRKITKITKIE
jgi:hypothetical protein